MRREKSPNKSPNTLPQFFCVRCEGPAVKRQPLDGMFVVVCLDADCGLVREVE